jgi:hypothetical protein
MATKNDVTGDALRSRGPSKAYADGWDRIFGKKKDESKETEAEAVEPSSEESTKVQQG